MPLGMEVGLSLLSPTPSICLFIQDRFAKDVQGSGLSDMKSVPDTVPHSSAQKSRNFLSNEIKFVWLSG